MEFIFRQRVHWYTLGGSFLAWSISLCIFFTVKEIKCWKRSGLHKKVEHFVLPGGHLETKTYYILCDDQHAISDDLCNYGCKQRSHGLAVGWHELCSLHCHWVPLWPQGTTCLLWGFSLLIWKKRMTACISIGLNNYCMTQTRSCLQTYFWIKAQGNKI